MEKWIEKLKVGDCVLLHEKGEVVKLKVEGKTYPSKPNTEKSTQTITPPLP